MDQFVKFVNKNDFFFFLSFFLKSVIDIIQKHLFCLRLFFVQSQSLKIFFVKQSLVQEKVFHKANKKFHRRMVQYRE